MKKLQTAFLVLALICGHLFWRTLRNEQFIAGWQQGRFDAAVLKELEHFNFVQGYVPYYNQGNAAYVRKDYRQAVMYYRQALDRFPAHPDECRIRVNLALSMLALLDENAEGFGAGLLAAREVLTEENCASLTGNEGHSETAEILKQDIDDMLSQLEVDLTEQNRNDEGEEKQQAKDAAGDDLSAREDEVQKKLEQQMRRNMKERARAQQEQSDLNAEEDFRLDYNGRAW